MAALVGNFWRLRVVSQGWTGGPGLNTFYFHVSDGDAAEGEALAGDVRAFFELIKGGFPNVWSCQVDASADILLPEDGSLVGSVAITAPAPTTGTDVSLGFAPAGSSALLAITTDDVADGSRVQGRHHLGPTSASAISAGQISASFREDLQDAYVGEIIGGTGTPVVWRRPRPSSAPGGARDGSIYAVTGCIGRAPTGLLKSRRD